MAGEFDRVLIAVGHHAVGRGAEKLRQRVAHQELRGAVEKFGKAVGLGHGGLLVKWTVGRQPESIFSAKRAFRLPETVCGAPYG